MANLATTRIYLDNDLIKAIKKKYKQNNPTRKNEKIPAQNAVDWALRTITESTIQ